MKRIKDFFANLKEKGRSLVNKVRCKLAGFDHYWLYYIKKPLAIAACLIAAFVIHALGVENKRCYQHIRDLNRQLDATRPPIDMWFTETGKAVVKAATREGHCTNLHISGDVIDAWRN